MKQVILVHGKPGLGKSTLAANVAQALLRQGVQAAHFSMGERLRAISGGEVVSQYTGVLRAEHAVLYRHAHVTDPAIIHGVVGEFLDATTDDVAVIDGHPRYMEIAHEYERALQAHGWHTALVVIIDGSDELACERMAKRHRSEHGVVEDPVWRLADYQKTMAPVLAWLAAQYPVLHVTASDDLEQKTRQVIERLRSNDDR